MSNENWDGFVIGTIDGDSCTGSGKSENDSSLTGPPDSESEDEFFKLPEKLGTMASPNVHKVKKFWVKNF